MTLPLLRRRLFEEMRRATADDHAGRGGRRMVRAALAVAAPRAPLGRRLRACGTRKGGSRVLCGHPACTLCMHHRADWLFLERLWPALRAVPEDRLRWVTVLAFAAADLDAGAAEMERHLRRLRHLFKRFSGGGDRGARRGHGMRVFGCREVERDRPGGGGGGGEWVFHFHFLVDLGTADAAALAAALRERWPGPRSVMVSRMRGSAHRTNVLRLAHYMTKARYTEGATGSRTWMGAGDIAALALWRDRMPAQWHRWTWGVRAAL